MTSTTLRLVSLVACMAAASSESTAATIPAGSATYRYNNTFFTRLFPGTPFNPGPVSVDVPVSASGVFTQVWETQSGDAIVDELTSIVATGSIGGPTPIPFGLFAGIDEVPELGPFNGSLSSIVNDPQTGELVSAFRTVGGPFLQVLGDGTRLYSSDPYTFVASVDSLPFEVGNVFIGTQNAAARVQVGPTIDPINDPIIGLVLAGGVIEIAGIIPEPSSAVLVLVAGGWLVGRARTSR